MAGPNPSASYSLTIRVEIPAVSGSFAKVAAAIGEADGDLGAIDLVRVSRESRVRDVTVSASDSDHGQRIVDAVRSVAGRHHRERLRPHVPHAPGRQDRGAEQGAGEDARRPVDGLHARRRPGVPRDRRRPRQGAGAHDQAERGRRRDRRDGGARARRHRPAGGDAGDGGQGDALQGVRRDRRLADLPRHDRHRRDHHDREGDRAGLRRDQSRGHRRAALLRDRGAPAPRARHPRLPRRSARHRRRRPGRAS